MSDMIECIRVIYIVTYTMLMNGLCSSNNNEEN